MLMMAIADGITYTNMNYEMKKKLYSNFGYIFGNAVITFKKHLRLIIPPYKFLFTPEAN
jgi:hypothetical protein